MIVHTFSFHKAFSPCLCTQTFPFSTTSVLNANFQQPVFSILFSFGQKMHKSPIKKISRRSYRNNPVYQLKLAQEVHLSKELAEQKAKYPQEPYITVRNEITGEVKTVKSDQDIAELVKLPRSTIYDRKKTPMAQGQQPFSKHFWRTR